MKDCSALLSLCLANPLVSGFAKQWDNNTELIYEVNSLRPGDALCGIEVGSSLVHVMACHLFSAKPLPEPLLIYCHVDTQEEISMEFKPK